VTQATASIQLMTAGCIVISVIHGANKLLCEVLLLFAQVGDPARHQRIFSTETAC
jgi:hypothetical protein